jgi:hypothetical protein
MDSQRLHPSSGVLHHPQRQRVKKADTIQMAEVRRKETVSRRPPGNFERPLSDSVYIPRSTLQFFPIRLRRVSGQPRRRPPMRAPPGLPVSTLAIPASTASAATRVMSGWCVQDSDLCFRVRCSCSRNMSRSGNFPRIQGVTISTSRVPFYLQSAHSQLEGSPGHQLSLYRATRLQYRRRSPCSAAIQSTPPTAWVGPTLDAAMQANNERATTSKVVVANFTEFM